MPVNLIDGYSFKVVARFGLAAQVPTLIVGELGYDTDTKTMRIGDNTSMPPKIMTTKSIGNFDFSTTTLVKFARIDMVNGGRVDGVDLSTGNVTDGLVVRVADGQLANRSIVAGNSSISVVNGNGKDGNPDVRVSDALIAALRPPKHWTGPTAPSQPVVGDHWHDTSVTEFARVWYRDTDGDNEFWTLLSEQYENATETDAGITRYATNQEAIDRAEDEAALTPKNLNAILGAGIDFRPVINATEVTPPPTPTARDAYLIPVGATGPWSAHVGKVATYDGTAWVYEVLRLGAFVVDRNKAITNPLRYLQQTANQSYTAVQANDTDYGFTRRATQAEILARSNVNAYMSPDGLRTIVQLQPLYPEITTNNGRITITASTGQIIVDDTAEWQMRGLNKFKSSDISLADRTFILGASKTYHLVWDTPGLGLATPTNTFPNGRFSLLERVPGTESDPTYDTTMDRMLLARIVTNASNVPTVTTLLNKQFMTARIARTTFDTDTSWTALSAAQKYLIATINWSRSPRVSIDSFNVDASLVGESMVGVSNTNTRYSAALMAFGYLVDPGNVYGPEWDYISGQVAAVLYA